MSTKELMQQIKELMATAKIDIMNINPAVRPGVEGQIRSATQRLPDLIKQYKKAVLEASVPILVSGINSADFANSAESSFGTVSINYNAANDRILNDILARSQRPEFGNQEYLLLLNQLNVIGFEVGAAMMAKPDLNQELVGKPIKNAVESILNNFYGDELRSIYAAQLAADKALEAGFDGSRLPVVLFNSSGKVSAPFGKPVATLEINEIPTTEEMSETFNKIKSKLKSKK